MTDQTSPKVPDATTAAFEGSPEGADNASVSSERLPQSAELDYASVPDGNPEGPQGSVELDYDALGSATGGWQVDPVELDYGHQPEAQGTPPEASPAASFHGGFDATGSDTGGPDADGAATVVGPSGGADVVVVPAGDADAEGSRAGGSDAALGAGEASQAAGADVVAVPAGDADAEGSRAGGSDAALGAGEASQAAGADGKSSVGDGSHAGTSEDEGQDEGIAEPDGSNAESSDPAGLDVESSDATVGTAGESSSTEIDQVPDPEAVERRLNEMRQEGHGPQRHEGDVMSDGDRKLVARLGDYLRDSNGDLVSKASGGYRVTGQCDPETGTTTDADRGDVHYCGPYATAIPDATDYVRAESAVHRLADTLPATAAGLVAVLPEHGLKLAEVFGQEYADKCVGRMLDPDLSRPGAPAYKEVDFTDGTLAGLVYRQPDGTYRTKTLYASPSNGHNSLEKAE